MPRSSHAEKTQRLNAAFQLLARGRSMVDTAEALSKQFGLSHRQSYRYVQQAQSMHSPVTVGAPSIPITLKVPADVVKKLRAYARRSGVTIGETVARALRTFLAEIARRG